MNYKQQLEVIQGLFVPPDTAMRMDCPFCSGKNTLSVDTMNNNINWYCFHASCSAKGKYYIIPKDDFLVEQDEEVYIVHDFFETLIDYIHYKNDCID